MWKFKSMTDYHEKLRKSLKNGYEEIHIANIPADIEVTIERCPEVFCKKRCSVKKKCA